MKREHVTHNVEDVVDDDQQPYRQPFWGILGESRVSDMEGAVFGSDEPRDNVGPVNQEVSPENHQDRGNAPNEKKRQGIACTVDKASHESLESFGLFVYRHPIVLDDVISDKVK